MKNRAFRPSVDRLEERTALSLGAMMAPEAALVTPLERTDPAAVLRHQEILARIRTHQDDVIFLGDSIVEYWGRIAGPVWRRKVEPLGAANFGVASDTTRHLLWRLENGLLAGRPKVAVVAIGTNDLLFVETDPATRVANTAAGITSVVATIRTLSPGTKVLLMGLFPQGATPDDPSRIMIRQVNEQIAGLADGANIRYLDISAAFLKPDGTHPATPYGIHPTPQEYDAWAEAISGPIRQWLGRPVAPTVRDLRGTRPRRNRATIVPTFHERLNADSAEDPPSSSPARVVPRLSRQGPQRLRSVMIQHVTYDPTAQTVTLSSVARPHKLTAMS